VLLERPVELLDPLGDRPAQLEAGQRGQLAAVHPVAAQARPGALGEGQLAAGHDLADHLGHLADAVVLAGQAHVEGLAVDQLAGRLQHRQERGRDVLDVDQRAPRSLAGYDGRNRDT
jgi:hypothetical protein